MEHRQLQRISLPRPILICSRPLGLTDSLAVLRDISARGAYCYTLLPLAKGEIVELFVTVEDTEGTAHLSLTGEIVRVENGVTDNSVGIAVAFSTVKESEEQGCIA